MFWPNLVVCSQTLPEVEELAGGTKTGDPNVAIEYDPTPHLDPVIQTLTNDLNFPYVVLTYRSIYLFDSRTNSPIAAHIRSNNSLDEYGRNLKIKRSPNGKQFAVETSKNMLLIFTLKSELSDELLTIFNTEGKIIQNGLPVIAEVVENANSPENLVKTFINVLLSGNNMELPNYDYGLRLKLVLNVQSPLADYCFSSNGHLLLVNSKPHAFQTIQLASAPSQSDIDAKDQGKHIKFILVEELEWYHADSTTRELFYNFEMGCFVWLNEAGDCWLVQKRGGADNVEFVGKQIHSSLDGRVVKCLINHFRNLVYFGMENGDLVVAKLLRTMAVKKLRVIKKHVSSQDLQNLVLSPDGDSLIALYRNGWNVYSTLGNLNFSTYDYESADWLRPTSIGFISNFELILATEHKLHKLNLVTLNHSRFLSSATFKRPVLLGNDRLSLFRAFDKNLIDHWKGSPDTSNKETNSWFDVMLPISFFINNREIRCCAMSDDGNYVCVVGNRDVFLYNLVTDEWKELNLTEKGDKPEINPVRICIWWKSYLLLGSKTFETEAKSEVVLFSTKILEKNAPFTYDQIVWGFNFEETALDENFLSFNIDMYHDELLVMSDKMNCYTWKIGFNGQRKSGQSLLLRKSNVYQLRNCFEKELDSVVYNFKAVVKVNEDDLLVLANCDLTYIRKEVVSAREKAIYHSYLLSNTVEYVAKPTPNLVAVFDGCEILLFDFANEKNMMKVLPIAVQTGNQTQTKKDQVLVVESNGTNSYPLTMMNDKNMIFGIEIDYSPTSNLKIGPTRKNYLNNVLDHYIRLNLEIDKGDNSNILSLSSIFKRFHRFKHFVFVLELLLMNYIQRSYDNEDDGTEYFERLVSLIKMTGMEYSVYLNCLKKIEVQYWATFFDKYGETPRQMLAKINTGDKDFKLCAHYFIIMLNYEENDEKISGSDIQLINEILVKLVLTKDFETSFELVRFIKLIDDKICAKIVGNLESRLKAYQR
ncbi:hypothetical protein OGAPHI_002459 [Ogataea philodendri]|uniref:RIC1 C-terminal alpha solenoid region domain-containing protein n=1 Tax=Ogataea philodendri TaxID=1378263 RepID=A0A9P8T809_9ASCO|nr:uncharacterized protein OGAPHI_002459 [Ogataea philodendri]KAH3668705.1 hypothetical protein OGAPHI_002459 [Ogataea philodendri]